MLNLAHFEKLANRLWIKPRDNVGGIGKPVPFTFNPSQHKIMAKLHERRAQGKPLWMIFLKARRLGVSTFTSALLITQQIQKANCQGMIIAQIGETAKALFEQSRELTACLPLTLPPATQSQITFPHSGGVSTLRKATAKTVIGGRGLTLNGIHMTEAAFYPGEDSFIAILNTISGKDPDNIVVVETTANGMEGPGEAYYNYWNDAVAGKNDFMPIFLPWYEDPGSFLPDDLAPDAPADDYETFLMKDFKVTKGQIAWFRLTMATKCSGSIHKWRQEYPALPEEAFISTGNPAFDFKEMHYAATMVQEPISEQKMVVVEKKVAMEEALGGDLKIWEWPIPKCHYYMGVDAAKGVEHGDFASAVCWNAETGEQAFTYAARVGPEHLAGFIYHLGMMWNKAMVNVEITGGWGYIVLQHLRDYFHYPSQYLWMGRDDRFDKKGRPSMGFETNMRSRQRILALFRTALRNGTIKVRDQEIVSQMSKCKMELGWRWTVAKGHDDVMMAALLGWVAVEDHHFPHDQSGRATSTLKEGIQPQGNVKWVTSPESTAMGSFGWSSTNHLAKLRLHSKLLGKKNLLEGV